MDRQKIHTAVIGSGAAGFNAADELHNLGVLDIAIFTEGVLSGTSRNAGSDKQTYYKLSLSGEPDSVGCLADTLFGGGSVDGDTALAEAAGSVRAFVKLANLGVPFPTNEYGEYIGYKTDHDPKQRATSSGPLTSKYMVEALERSVMQKGIKIYDGYEVIKLIVEGGRAVGFIALFNGEMRAVETENIILCTGGPSGVYKNSVFPICQTGSTGLAIDAGCELQNFAEWQYGLASTKFRWNVSGTYQQVLPRFLSIDKNGVEREFLLDYFDEPNYAYSMVFLKGYEWPYDVKKIQTSSKIDMIIHKEISELGNRVYMDFINEPKGLDFDKLEKNAKDYLDKSKVSDVKSPINRLKVMNPKAIELYLNNGIDLTREYLEVAVSSQHCNGGIAVDANWQTSIKSLYAAGEAAGTFGIYRPGGSALNSGQVGSRRAAEHISKKFKSRSNAVDINACLKVSKDKNGDVPEDKPCLNAAEDKGCHAAKDKGYLDKVFKKAMSQLAEQIVYGKSTVIEQREQIQTLMSKYAAHIRDIPKVEELLKDFYGRLDNFFDQGIIKDNSQLGYLYKNKDILISALALLESIVFSAPFGSRGSGLVINSQQGTEDDISKNVIVYADGKCWMRPVRPIPKVDNWFENVWNKA